MGQPSHFIRRWREHRQMSQEELAERIGMSRPHLSRIENEKRPYDQFFLEAAARELRCTVLDLLGRDPGDHEGLWALYGQLTSAQRRQLVEIGRTFPPGTGFDDDHPLMVAEGGASFTGQPGGRRRAKRETPRS